MKESILNLLYTSKDYLSGEEISQKLGVTRSSIWKHINTLKKEGYLIEGVSKKGYKLISSPTNLTEFDLKKSLNTSFIGKEVHLFDSIDSTNKLGKTYAESGATDGTLLISKIQTLGKGRFDRAWSSPNGGLWFSIILKPNSAPINASKVPIIAAASINKALKKFNIETKIKWPNDILLNGKKLGGILTEMSCELDTINHIILGIGLNINIPKDHFNDELKVKATSLLNEYKKEFSIKDILISILEEFEVLYKELLTQMEIPSSIKICKENSCIIDNTISISNGYTTIQGKAVDLSLRGGLIIQLEDNSLKEVLSGEVSISSFYKEN